MRHLFLLAMLCASAAIGSLALGNAANCYRAIDVGDCCDYHDTSCIDIFGNPVPCEVLNPTVNQIVYAAQVRSTGWSESLLLDSIAVCEGIIPLYCGPPCVYIDDEIPFRVTCETKANPGIPMNCP